MNAAPISQTYRAAVATAWIAGLFLIGVSATMLYQRFTADSNDPWKSPQLLALKEQMRAAPKDERIKEQIRELDLKFRQRYVRRLTMVGTGGWLLFGGALVLVGALTVAMETRKQRPQPVPDREAGDRALRQTKASRRAVAITGGVVLVAMAGIATQNRTSLGGPVAAAPAGGASTAAVPTVVAAESLPPQSDFLANWPRFRGPTGSGVAATTDAPLRWDEKAGTGVVWKAEVPVAGFNSPVVWGNRIFIAGGNREKREVLCYETSGGKLLWRRAIENVPGAPAKAPAIPDQTGYAAPTMATDGLRAYVIFATGDLAAVTFDGVVAWSRHLGVPRNQYGHSTSLALWQGAVVVQLDQGDTSPANSRLIAYEGATGKVRWEKPRQIPTSWSSPIIIEAAGKTQIITLGLPLVIAYDFKDGSELWRAEVLEGEVTPSPVLAGDLILAVYPHNALVALRPNGTGDVGATHVAWKAEGDIPDVASPVSDGKLAFTVASTGNLSCFDMKDGTRLWEQDLQQEVQASPAISGNRLYVNCVSGLTIVVEVGRTYKELARNELAEKVVASPAFAPGRIYVRGMNSLYALSAAAAPATKP